jgi:uncharacterized protein YndB with AHSA1/START domain
MPFDLVTDWHLAAPVEQVWALLRDVQGWPNWWPNVAEAERLERGDREGVGAVHRIAWTTALPYRLTFTTRVVAIEPMRQIEIEAWGEMDGSGTWTLLPEGDGVQLRYRWRVAPRRPWMRRLAPLLRPVFAWNHGRVMASGRKGLEAGLSGYSDPASPPSAASPLSPASSPSPALTK